MLAIGRFLDGFSDVPLLDPPTECELRDIPVIRPTLGTERGDLERFPEILRFRSFISCRRLSMISRSSSSTITVVFSSARWLWCLHQHLAVHMPLREVTGDDARGVAGPSACRRGPDERSPAGWRAYRLAELQPHWWGTAFGARQERCRARSLESRLPYSRLSVREGVAHSRRVPRGTPGGVSSPPRSGDRVRRRASADSVTVWHSPRGTSRRSASSLGCGVEVSARHCRSEPRAGPLGGLLSDQVA